MRIAIIEDEDQIRNGLRHLMAHIHPEHQVVGTASDGQQGLELIRKKLPDIVITDVRMPNMDGLQMIEQVVREGLRVKFIIISAFSEFSYAKTAMSYGVTEYLLKPLSITELTGALKKLELQISGDSLKVDHNSIEDAMKMAVLQGYVMTKQDFQRIALRHQIPEDARFTLLLFYYGNRYASYPKDNQNHVLRKFKTEAEAACSVEMEGHSAILYILYGTEPPEDFAQWLEMSCKVYNSNLWGGAEVSLGFCSSLAQLYEAAKGMLEALPWRMAFPDRQILRWPEVLSSQTVPCTFPVEIENQLRTAMCSRQLRKIGRTFDQFNLYFSGDYIKNRLYTTYRRFSSNIILYLVVSAIF